MIDQDKIEDFDIILSKGQSAQSKLISLFKFSLEDYSHIGIIVKEKGKVFVLHSTPDGTKTSGIRYDDLLTFFNLSDVSDYIVLRHHNISSELRQKLKIDFYKYKSLQAPFDYNFNNFEHEKIYCSELVWLIFKNSELLETGDFNFNRPIYPKYFLQVKKLEKVNCKKVNI